MKIPDLTQSFYRAEPSRPILLVGNISQGEDDYTVGQTPSNMLDKLRIYCQKPTLIKRSLHFCAICGMNYDEYSKFYKYNCEDICKSNADVLLKGSMNIVYKAPVQIYHYIRDHNYLPPEEFVEAVLLGKMEDMSWYADPVLE